MRKETETEGTKVSHPSLSESLFVIFRVVEEDDTKCNLSSSVSQPLSLLSRQQQQLLLTASQATIRRHRYCFPN